MTAIQKTRRRLFIEHVVIGNHRLPQHVIADALCVSSRASSEINAKPRPVTERAHQKNQKSGLNGAGSRFSRSRRC